MSEVTQTLDPELFIGLVGAVGTDLDKITNIFVEELKKVRYNTQPVFLSELLKQVPELIPEHDSTNEYERIKAFMDAGDELRKKTSDGSILAKFSIAYIRDFRETEKGKPDEPISKQAYIFKSLKHKDEVRKLREIYGKNFLLVSSYSPRNKRVDYLADKIGKGVENDKFRKDAEELIERDHHDDQTKLGQNVRETFPKGDVFIDTNSSNVNKSIERFTALIFGNTFYTPTPEEYGMFHAYASAFRSSSLSRQVGSSITTPEGDIISTGTNEVPKAGGGHYITEDEGDAREFQIGFDSNTYRGREILRDFLEKLKEKEWLSDKIKDSKNLIKEALDIPEIRNSRFLDLTEYGREVHAEMSALMDATRRTINVIGNIMYCTTFPCHVCVKHIIASGITKVVFIEPYPKSLAKELFPDSITVDEEQKQNKVHFKSFIGISPLRYMDLFAMLERKDEDGKKKSWVPSSTKLRYSERQTYDEKEGMLVNTLSTLMTDQNLKWKKN